MPWVLVFFIASVSNVTPVTVPMANEKLCRDAVEQLKAAYQKTQSVNYLARGRNVFRCAEGLSVEGLRPA